MMDSQGPPPHWPWSYRIEWRVMRLEEKMLGKKTTERDGERQQWTPRDLLIASAGIAMVIGTLCEKTGLTSVGMMILKTVVKAYGER